MADHDVHADRRSSPRTVLHTRDGVVLVVGLVLGAGIVRAPQLGFVRELTLPPMSPNCNDATRPRE